MVGEVAMSAVHRGCVATWTRSLRRRLFVVAHDHSGVAVACSHAAGAVHLRRACKVGREVWGLVWRAGTRVAAGAAVAPRAYNDTATGRVDDVVLQCV